jgi:hypothetical protein
MTDFDIKQSDECDNRNETQRAGRDAESSTEVFTLKSKP